jgi:hypothetical protein
MKKDARHRAPFSCRTCPLPPPEIKFIVVAPAAVAGSFALARVLARVPGIKRILLSSG